MEKRCEHCGMQLLTSEEKEKRGRSERWHYSRYWDFCDGELTLGPDPFQEEIHDDHSDYLMCEGARAASALDI